MHNEHHQVMEQPLMDETMFRMVSEMLLLSLLMMGSTASVLVDEWYSGARDLRQRGRWGLGSHL